MINLTMLRVTGFLEGISFIILLGICMPLKYAFDFPEPTRPVGMIHGILFVAYCLLVLVVAGQLRWSRNAVVWAIIAAFVPFGTFIADVRLFRK